VGCELRIASFVGIVAKLVSLFLFFACVPIYGCIEEDQIKSQINKEVSRIVAFLPTKRQIGNSKQILNDFRLAMVYNQEFSDNDDRKMLRSAKGVIMFIVIEKFGKSARLYYSIIDTYQKSLEIIENIRSVEDFDKKLFMVSELSEKELALLTKSKLSISLVPDSSSKVGAPWGILAFCGIEGDPTIIKFGKGEWLDVNFRGQSCPDEIANNLFRILEHKM